VCDRWPGRCRQGHLASQDQPSATLTAPPTGGVNENQACSGTAPRQAGLPSKVWSASSPLNGPLRAGHPMRRRVGCLLALGSVGERISTRWRWYALIVREFYDTGRFLFPASSSRSRFTSACASRTSRT
jgi:hypothetical protein